MTEKDKTRVIDFDFFENLTGDLSAPAAPEVEAVGSRIRALRQEKGVSLEDVSRLTGFEVTFLADVEAGRAQPQLGAMIRLSKALDGAFGRLISGTGTRLYSITRRHERRAVARSTSAGGSKTAYAYKSLAPDVKGRHMEALMVQLTATAERDVSVHDGEEFIFVLEGLVALEIGNDRFELEPGDSAYYLSTTPHFITAKEGTATILAVLYAQTS
jgi:transcriptional regulator with XRE-family HTH domain